MDDDDRNNRPRGKFIYSSVAVTDDSDLTEVSPGLFYHRAKGPIPEPEPEPEIRSIRVREPFIPCAACPDRQIRREAWATIFEELGADRLSERLDLARRLISMVKDYRYDGLRRVDRRGAKKRSRVYEKRRKLASDLAKLIEDNPEDDRAMYLALSSVQGRQAWTDDGSFSDWHGFEAWTAGLVAALHAVADAEDFYPNTFRKTGEHSPFLPLGVFVGHLESLYTERTGRKPGRSVNPYTDEPQGPYVRFLQAIFDLIGEEHAVENSIKTRQQLLKAAAGQNLG